MTSLSFSDSDRQVLMKIFAEEYYLLPQPTIYTSKYLNTRHSVDRVEGQATVLDYVRTCGTPKEAAIVFNHLVDRCAIEAVVVCKTQTEAKNISSFAKDVPPRMKYAITLDFNKFHPPNKHGIGYRTTYIEQIKERVIGTDLSQTLDLNEKEVQNETEHLAVADSNIAEGEKVDKSLKEDIVQARRKTLGIREELKKIETQLIEISSMMPEMTNNVQELRDGCTEKREGLELTKQKEEELQTKKKHLSEELERRKELFNEKKAKLSQELETTSGPIEKHLTELERQISEKTKLIKNQEQAKCGQQKLLVDLQTNSEKIKSRLAVERKAAEVQTKGCVLKPSLTPLQIRAKINRIQEQKKKNPTEVARRQRDQIGVVYQEKQKLFAAQKSRLEALKKISTEMEDASWARKNAFLLIRKFVCSRVTRQFCCNSETFSREVKDFMSSSFNI